MKNLQATLALLIALLLGAAPAFAAATGGGEPLNFLLLDGNARAVALGGAYTALATDANALLYNPAGLARISRDEATFMHNSYFTGVYQEYAAYASPKGWGANLNYLNSGSVANTSVSNPDGSGGSSDLTDLAFTGGYGRKLGESLSVGGSLKYVRESIAGVTGTAFALDAGAMFAVSQVPGLTLGGSILNLGPTVKFQAANENLPLNIRGGAAYIFDVMGQKSTFAFDVSKERSSSLVVAFGMETVLAKVLPIRLGFTTNNDAGPGITTGVGYIYNGLAFDYAFVPLGDLGNAHRMSVTWRWGAPKKSVAATSVPAPIPVAAPPVNAPADTK